MEDREELTLLFSECYSKDGSGCKLHPVFQPQKAINKLLELGYRKPGEPLSPEERDIIRKKWLSSQPQFFDDLIDRAAKAQLDKEGG